MTKAENQQGQMSWQELAQDHWHQHHLALHQGVEDRDVVPCEACEFELRAEYHHELQHSCSL